MKKLQDNLNAYTTVVLSRASITVNTKVSEVIKKNSLTPTQFNVLDILYAKGELKIGELMETMFSTPGNMTCVIKNMENNGLIYRKIDEYDKRSFKVGLTDEGIKVIEKVLPIHLENIDKIFNVLEDDEKKTLITILKKFKNI